MADFRVPPLNRGERFYRALLCLYPARFRHAFAQDLIEAFRDQRRHAGHDILSSSLFWLAIAQDVLTQALAERAASLWLGPGRRPDHDRENFVFVVREALRVAELRFAARRLLRVRGFTAPIVLVLSLGIGAATTVFSVVDGVLLQPLPYAAPDELVALTNTVDVAGAGIVDQSDASLLLYQAHSHALTAIGGWRDRDVNLGIVDGEAGRPQRVSAASVTSNLFDVLGVSPLIGRGFRRGEDRVGAAPVVVLSYQFWQHHFGGAPTAIGRRITIDGVSREIVGVMPRAFVFPRSDPELWLPIPLDPAHANAGRFDYRSVGRMRRDATVASARTDLESLLPRILDEYPSGIPPAMWAKAHVRPLVTPFRDAIVGDVSQVLWILMASAVLVLLIACANAANLCLVRSDSRQLELAVRGVIGAGAARIVAPTLSESLVLSFAGGAIGLSSAALGVAPARHFAAQLNVPRFDQLGIGIRVVGFAVAASALCAVFMGLIPALRARRVPLEMVFRDVTRAPTRSARRHVARSVLVVAQVALALLLVVASGLLARSFGRLRHVGPGFSPANVTMTRLVLPSASYRTPASRARFYRRVLERVRALPGVQNASISDWVPLTSDHNVSVVDIGDHSSPPNAVPRVHATPHVDPRYFTTMRIPLLAGRAFESADPTRPSIEAIVSRAFAERYWPSGSALGKEIRPGVSGPWLTIVGEVGDVHYTSLTKPAEDAVYLPLFSATDSSNVTAPQVAALLVRSVAPHEEVAASVRRTVRALDPSLPTYDERSLTRVVSAASSRARATLVLLAVAAVLALVLGAVGMHGVMSYGVRLRRRELGVRIALGARPWDVSGMIARQGLALAIVGVSLGIACAFATTRLLRGLLYDVSPTDPLTFGITCVVLLGIGALASWAPARRAASIDPGDALRGI